MQECLFTVIVCTDVTFSFTCLCRLIYCITACIRNICHRLSSVRRWQTRIPESMLASLPQRCGQTDGRMTYDSNTALALYASHCKNQSTFANGITKRLCGYVFITCSVHCSNHYHALFMVLNGLSFEFCCVL